MSGRADLSMRLLGVLRENAMDPGYRAAPRRGRGSPLLLALVCALIGVMLVVSMRQGDRDAAAIAVERADLINRIERARVDRDKLNAERRDLDEQVARLGSHGVDEATLAQIERLQPMAAASAVVGPGVRIVLDDGPGGAQDAVVNDSDLRRLVNGLWAAGAEAVSINGHRLGSRTAIRNAGAAITVEYSSLVRPYRVEAIGDPRRLPARFAGTSGATWWNYLKDTYGMKYELAVVDELSLPADPALGPSRAKAASGDSEEER